MLEYTRGNLLRANTEALVNPVNCVGVMGKGLAAQFKTAFPENFEAYRQACKDHLVRRGKMFSFPVQSGPWTRWIINFPTKQHWVHKSSLQDIETGLDDLVKVIRDKDIKSISVPRLGCGEGGLSWNDVRPLVVEKLGSIDGLRVVIYGGK